MCGAKRSPSAVALCFVAGYLRLTFGDHARGETRGCTRGALNDGTGLDVAGPNQLMVLVHVPHSIELILWASVPCSAGTARGCYALVQTGCPQRRAGLVRTIGKGRRSFREPAGTTNTIKYYYCMRLAASFAGVAKPGQRRWIQGPVTKVFVGSNPIPRT